jgi:hypothetical protein
MSTSDLHLNVTDAAARSIAMHSLSISGEQCGVMTLRRPLMVIPHPIPSQLAMALA